MQNSYDAIAEQWHANSRAQSYVDKVLRYVDLVLEDLPSGAKVLDLGCGTGNPIAKHILEKGFGVVGIDQSKKMLAIARDLVPEAELIHSDMIKVKLSDGFGAAIVWDSLFHVERQHHSSIFHKLATRSGFQL